MAPTAANAALPPLILPPWLVEKDRYNIKLPHIDTLVAIADKGRQPRRNSCPIGPAPSGLYKTAQDTIPQDVPKLVIPTTQYVPILTPPPFPFSRFSVLCGTLLIVAVPFFCVLYCIDG